MQSRDSSTLAPQRRTNNAPCRRVTPARLAAGLILALTLALGGCGDDDAVSSQARDHLSRSQTYADQGQYRAAVIEARNALNQAPDNLDVRLHLARLYLTLGAGRQAEALLSDLDDTSPPSAQLTLAEAYLDQGKHLSASEWLDRVDFSEPEHAFRQRLLRARATLEGGDAVQASDQLQALLDESPDSDATRSALISARIEAGRLPAARAAADALLERQPDATQALFMRGQVAYLEDDLDRAEDLLTRAAGQLSATDQLLPEKVRVLQLLARTLTDQGKYAQAMRYNQALAEASPEATDARQRFTDALEAARNGELDRAKTAFEDLLAAFPGDQHSAMMLGMINLQQGDIDQGEALLSDHLDAETAPVEMIQAAALAQIELGKSDEAIGVLRRALLARPDDVGLMALYGVFALTREDRAREGVATLNKALRLDPERTRLRLALAQYHRGEGAQEQALAQLRTAFETDPGDWPTTGYYLATLAEGGEQAEADSVLERLLDRQGEAPNAQLIAAITEHQLGRTEAALQRLTRLVEREPAFTPGRQALARLHESRGDRESAAHHYLALARQQPDNLAALQAAARLSPAAGSAEAMLDWLDDQAGETPELEPNTTALQADLERRRGNLDRALALTAEREDHGPSRQVRASIQADRAYQFAREENWDAARTAAGEAIRLAPAVRSLQLLMAQLEAASGNTAEADAILDRLAEADPDNADTRLGRASIIREIEGDRAAYDYLKPHWPDGRLADLTLALARSQAPGEVDALVEAWSEAEAENPRAWLARGDQHLRADETVLAQQAYERALALDADNVIALNNLAWLLREKDTDLALTYARRAGEARPDDPGVLDTRAMVLMQAGQLAEAESLLERALSLAPDHPDISEHLSEVRARLGS